MTLERRIPAIIIALVLLAAVGHGQAPAPAAEEPPFRGGPPEFKALKYRSIGPARGGRVARVAGIPGDPTTYYAATASGGVWKTTDAAVTWKAIFDDQPISSIGSIAVAPSDPHVVYVGSGEANIRGNVAAGNGIYKSIDAGKSWTHVWRQAGQIGAMAVHPKNPDIAFAAVLGHAFGPNAERGVYRTRDGGKTWQQVLAKDADTGASDVAIDQSNPNVVFAGFWQARRLPWDLVSGGPGSGLYVSRDGGDTWTPLKGHGLPDGIWGKVGVAIAPSDSRRVYALIEAEKGGLFRSDDGGESWTLATANRAIRQRAWYYSTMTVSPRNPDEVWFPQVPMLRTIDGGKTLTYTKGLHHGDHHDIWIDPANPKRMIAGNDGGVDITVDGGDTWSAPPLPIGQFYHVSADTRVPYRVAGAMQDLGTAQGPSNSLARPGITSGDWYDVGGGEAGHVVSDPSNPDIVYAGEYLGYISRYDHRTRQARNVSAFPENGSGHGGEDFKYRFQWTAPIATSPHDSKVVYHGGNVLFRTTDGGQTWAAISPDLTRDDKTKQKWAGGPITGDNTGVETYCTIFAIAESPRQKDVIWVGSDDGLVHVTRDGGKSWKNVTAAMTGIPQWGTISLIEPSPFDGGAAYVVVDAHRLDDMRPYLLKTTDYGQSWKRLDGSLASDVYLHAVREDPKKRGQLYLGTERGVMFSVNDGDTWQSLQLNLPTVAVHDLIVKDDDLVLATHGRSLWILDDLTPVRQMTPQVVAEPLFLFPPRDAIRWHYTGGPRDKAAGENPPRGAAFSYFLKEKPKGDVVAQILDGQGRVVRTLSSVPRPLDGSDDNEEEPKGELPSAEGVQRAVWDLTWDGAKKIKNAKIDTGDPAVGPLAVPGVYTLKLTANGRTVQAAITVKPDPRSTVSMSDLGAQLAFTLEIRDAITRLTAQVDRVRSIRTQLRARNEALKSYPRGAELIAAADAMIARLDALEEEIHNPKAEVVYDILAMKGGTRLYSRLSPLMDWAGDGDGPPTQGMREVFADQKRELDRWQTKIDALISSDLSALNEKARALGVAFVIVP
jgi:photosystem II stability/assembly factor-like uncharacterized protein